MTTVDTPASQGENAALNENSSLALIGQILCVVVPVIVWFAPLDLPPQTQHGFAIMAFMVIAWITQATEFALAGFIGCFLFWALGVVKFDVAFSGFANDTAWFLFAALLLGRIATKTGLARRIAYSIMLRLGVTYPLILLGMILTDFLLTFIVPSGIARVVIMASIALSLVEAFHAKKGSNIARGMFLILTYTGNIFDKMIIAGAGSITAAGLIAKVGGVEVSWAVWFLAFLPASIVTVLAGWWLTLRLYPPEQAGLSQGQSLLSRRTRQDGAMDHGRNQIRDPDRLRDPAMGDGFPAPPLTGHGGARGHAVRPAAACRRAGRRRHALGSTTCRCSSWRKR